MKKLILSSLGYAICSVLSFCIGIVMTDTVNRKRYGVKNEETE